MNTKFYDVLVAKEYESKSTGISEKKVAWNKVGRAWTSKNAESLSFELYLFPNQRYVIQIVDKFKNQTNESEITSN